ncbi:MAG TPA: FGGY-family carbohydrate kinase [Anaeromyxobacter sp.]|nr:FGGY-family carbohydrate kinase [Anaeromyxobacter sp.]
MPRAHILAYDLGTGGAKASLHAEDGTCLRSTFLSYDTRYPTGGWHEQRPDDWWRAVVEATRQLFSEGEASSLAGLAISGQSLGVVPVDDDGALLSEFTPIWSDTRSGEQTREFFSRVDPKRWYMTTGNGFPAECYAVFKAMWYRDQQPEMFRRIRWLLGSKDYINLRLTGRPATDFSYASGSGVYDLLRWGYQEEFIAASGLPRRIFPEILASSAIVGGLTPEAARALGLPSGLPVACGGVDNSCMALGARNLADGRVYTSLGSSCWIAVSSREPVLDPVRKPFVFTHVVPGLFTSAVSIFAGGSAFRWARDVLLGLRPADLGGRDAYEVMTGMAARSPIGANRLLFNPSLAGGSSQEASPNIRGGFFGLDLRHTRDDLVRSVMEGVALNLGAVLAVLRGYVRLDDEMMLVGGGSRSALWRQIFADVYGMRVVKTNVDQDAASLAAASLAAVGVGLWKDFAPMEAVHAVQAREEPRPEAVAAYARLMPVFERIRQDEAAICQLLLDSGL